MKNKVISEKSRIILFSIITAFSVIFSIFAIAMFSHRLSALVMLILVGAVTAVMLAFSSYKKNVLYYSLVSVMSALSILGRIVFSPVSGIKPCTAIIITCGTALGSDAGFLCGVVTALVSNIYFGQGSWTLFQMFAWGLIGFLSGALSRIFEKHKFTLYVFAAFSGFLYSLMLDLFSSLWLDGGFFAARFLALAASSFPFSVIYAVSNIIFLKLLHKRLSHSIKRVVNKYGATDGNH